MRPSLLVFAAALSVLISSASRAAGLEAAAVAIDLKPGIGIPLAGYGSRLRRLKPVDTAGRYPHSFFFRPSEGVHSPIRSKVLLLRKDERHLVFVSLDTIGVEKRFVRDLADSLRPLGIRQADLIVTGTHTHSGPGTLSRTLPLQLIATDLFIRENYDFVLSRVRESVIEAAAQLEPAELFTTSFDARGIQRNKFRRKTEEHFNRRASFLLARSKTTRQWLGGLVNFAIHGGGMPVELLLYSSDFPGQVELGIEARLRELNGISFKAPAVLFMNGAEGDVATPERGIEHIEKLGREFARQAEPALRPENLKPVAPEFSVHQEELWLGIPGSSLKFCVEGIFKRSPIPLRAPLPGAFSQRSTLAVVRVGQLTMLTWPGEPSTSLGFELQRIARQRGITDVWILGLTNDYMAYFTTKEEYFEAAYDSCSSLFNWRGGERILRAYDRMLKPR